MRLIVFVVCISLAFGQEVTEFCNENTSETAQKLPASENITSPNYPGEYNSNMDCYIRRYTDFTHLKIKFFAVDLEPNYDELYIFNGLVSKEDIESGAVQPDHTITSLPEEITLGNKVTLRLKSDESAEFTGVAMEISPYDVDECADSGTHNCDVNAHCHDVIGSFKCVCKNGFTGDGVSCTDINECTTNNHTCTENSICTNIPGHYTCACKHGFQQIGSQCIDIDECAQNSKICSDQAVCNNLPGSYKCVCANGYKGDGRICQDIDECASSSKDVNQCSVDAVCSNTIGSYDCTCKAGHKGDGRTCVEKLECSTGEHTCSSNAFCTETHGGYNCTCWPGYAGDGYICMDINECSTHTHNCSSNAVCTNLQGGFSCGCKSGFIGDGYTCTDINECNDARITCAENGQCHNNPGSYSCQCNEGYGGDPYSNCTDLNECEITPGICSAYGDCHNTIGSYSCTCHPGFSNPPSCADMNECKMGTHNCSELAFCRNTKGSYTCKCKKGYIGNGFTCQDYDECQNNKHKCNVNARCINTPGKYRCECKTGFIGNGYRCADVDECGKNLHQCSAHANCINTFGSYNCTCHPGYQGNGRVCEDVDECVTGTHRCDVNAKCTNIPGKYRCKCNKGYIGKGFTCTDIDECLKDPKLTRSCQPHGTCTNLPGDWTCTCDRGFQTVGHTCEDVDECLTGSHVCSPEATCTNLIGGHNCTCNTGFTGNGTVCTDVNECTENSHESLCAANSYCVNNRGGYDCECSTGFKLNNNICEDIDECILNIDDCSSNATCVNTIGNFTCHCRDGFHGDGRQCDDVDECAQNPGICGDHSKCSNLIGSHQCTCDGGFHKLTADGSCTDIDECSISASGIAAASTPCSSHAACSNSIGSFRCTCNHGYRGNGLTCTDIDECAEKSDDCDAHAACTNTNGSYTCHCDAGFKGNGRTCDDVNECSKGTHRCSNHADCINLHGSHQCSCHGGFTGNGTHCQDIDECSSGSDVTTTSASTASSVCGKHANCVNLPGDYECRCDIGYNMTSSSNSTCVDINECATIGCHERARCTNTLGSYECRCRKGFTGDGNHCTDIDECKSGEADCGSDSDCINIPGTFRCQCKTGYEDEGAGVCKAYCYPLTHDNYTFAKTPRESFAQSQEKCFSTGKSMARIYCDFSPPNEDGSEASIIASFNISTLVSDNCAPTEEDRNYPQQIEKDMVETELKKLESETTNNNFDVVHHKIHDPKLKHYVTKLDLHGKHDAEVDLDRFYVKVVETPPNLNKKKVVIHTERRLNQEINEVDIIDVTLPLYQVNRTTRTAVIVYKDSQSFFDESALDSRIVTVVAERGDLLQGNVMRMLKDPVSVRYDTHFKYGPAGSTSALHGTKKKLKCFRWDERMTKFVSDNCCLDDKEEGKPICNCNIVSDYAIVLTNEDERVKPTHATSVLVAYVIGMAGYSIAFFLLLCNRRVLGMRETYRYLCFSLTVIFFYGVLLFTDLSSIMDDYCHVTSIVLHFFALLGWFWLASIVKAAFDHNDKISEPIIGKWTILFSMIYHLLIAGLVVGISVGLTIGHFDKTLPLSSSQNGHRCTAKQSDSYYYSRLTCWLDGYAFLGGFIFFVGVIVIFILAICFLVAKTTSKTARHSVQYEILQQNRHHLFALGLFTIVHSLSWVTLLGYWKTVAMNFNVAFQWGFVVFNSFQGFHFCYVTCYQRPLVRKALFGCGSRTRGKNEISNDLSSEDRSSYNYNYTSTV